MEKQAHRSEKCLIQRKNSKRYGETLSSAIQRLDDYLTEYQSIFRNSTKKFFDKAEKYSKGLLLCMDRNIGRICESQHGLDYFQVQHFISDSNWSSRDAIDIAAIQTSNTLSRRKLTGLIIDETGTVKKGNKSVGVGWQYCGNVGKIANCQVSVVSCLCNGDFASITDARLFLPQDWCDGVSRCEVAGIPIENRSFKSKTEIAYDIVLHQLQLGVAFDFVGADGFYGNDTELADKLNDLGCTYMFDIHSNQTVYLEKPQWILPEKKCARGRSPILMKPDKASSRVDHYCRSLGTKEWKWLCVRNTTKGKLKAAYHFCTVYVENKTRNTFEERLLIIRKVKTKDGMEVKYSLTNANLVQYTEEAVAYMQAQRFFVEHSIKESKNIIGMDQFQTRKWMAWQHQVALNIIVACFILKEKLLCFDDLPLLSAYDIKEWIGHKLYKPWTDEQMIDRIFNRHLQRQKDINRYYGIN